MENTSVHKASLGRHGPTVRGIVPLLLAAAVAVLAIVAGPGVASPAWAHGDGPEGEGYVFVLQATSLLVNVPGAMGTAEAIEKVELALANEDQDGIDVEVLEEGMAALEAGDRERGQILLEESIAEAVASLESATGEESGTSVVLPELSSRDGLSTTDWIFLALSALVAAVGTILAIRFRPTESLRELGRNIATAKTAAREANNSTSKES